MNSFDIDVGGTFTDLVLNFNGQSVIRKVPTTIPIAVRTPADPLMRRAPATVTAPR